MYCNDCGKFIEGESTVCPDCQAARTAAANGGADGFYAPWGYGMPQNDPYYYSTEPEPHNRMFGFGKALASTLLATVGFVFSYLSIFLSLFGGGLVLTAISYALLVTAIVFGIQSIACFKRRSATCAKNIPTLVLGINGLAEAAFASFYAFFSLLIALAAL